MAHEATDDWFRSGPPDPDVVRWEMEDKLVKAAIERGYVDGKDVTPEWREAFCLGARMQRLERSGNL